MASFRYMVDTETSHMAENCDMQKVPQVQLERTDTNEGSDLPRNTIVV